MKNQTKTTERLWIFSIGILIISVAILHYSTPTQLHHFHQLYRVLFYLPIILAAFRYQLKGGVITAALVIIINVPPGTYQVKAMMMGYQPRRVENVRVSIDLTTTINIELNSSVLDLGEEVTVVAEREIIKKDMTSSLAAVSADEIKTMPVQEIADVLELQAGLVRDAVGGIHVRGGRSGEVAYWVDGIAATDMYSGNMGIEVENSSVQELQVIRGTFNAEYGQAMSGIVNNMLS